MNIRYFLEIELIDILSFFLCFVIDFLVVVVVIEVIMEMNFI